MYSRYSSGTYDTVSNHRMIARHHVTERHVDYLYSLSFCLSGKREPVSASDRTDARIQARSPLRLVKHHAIKTDGTVELLLHASLTSPLDGSQLDAPAISPLRKETQYPLDTTPSEPQILSLRCEANPNLPSRSQPHPVSRWFSLQLCHAY